MTHGNAPVNRSKTVTEWGIHWVYPNGRNFYVAYGITDSAKYSARAALADLLCVRPNSRLVARTVSTSAWEPAEWEGA
jgi:hypothetical protein